MKGFESTQGVELIVFLVGRATAIFFEVKGSVNTVGRFFFNRLKPSLNAVFHQDEVLYFFARPCIEGEKNKQELEKGVFAHVLGDRVT